MLEHSEFEHQLSEIHVLPTHIILNTRKHHMSIIVDTTISVTVNIAVAVAVAITITMAITATIEGAGQAMVLLRGQCTTWCPRPFRERRP